MVLKDCNIEVASDDVRIMGGVLDSNQDEFWDQKR
jgi:hypothetical protein